MLTQSVGRRHARKQLKKMEAEKVEPTPTPEPKTAPAALPEDVVDARELSPEELREIVDAQDAEENLSKAGLMKVGAGVLGGALGLLAGGFLDSWIIGQVGVGPSGAYSIALAAAQVVAGGALMLYGYKHDGKMEQFVVAFGLGVALAGIARAVYDLSGGAYALLAAGHRGRAIAAPAAAYGSSPLYAPDRALGA